MPLVGEAMVDCRLEILPRRGECEWKLEFFISDIDVHQNTDFSENITLLPLITGVLLAKILKTARVNVYTSAIKRTFLNIVDDYLCAMCINVKVEELCRIGNYQ